MSKPLYLFVHIPKTGGTTLNAHFYHNLQWDVEFIHLGPWGNEYRKRHAIPPVHQWESMDRDRVRVIGGHDVNINTVSSFSRREYRYITILRDPVKRLESMYNFYLCGFDQGEPFLEFWEWYQRTQGDNSMTKYLSKKGIDLQTLDSFWHVGDMRTLDKSIAHISRALDIKEKVVQSYRVADGEKSVDGLYHPDRRYLHRKFRMRDTTKAQLKKRNAEDYFLYSQYESKRD